MFYEITVEPACIRATLFGRETPEETEEFFRIVLSETQGHRSVPALLLDIRLSRPIFHVGPGAFFEGLRKLAGAPSCKIALLGDTSELCLSHEYLALLARQRGVNVWSFRTESAALKWLADRRYGMDRRAPSERRGRAADRPVSPARRRRERRFAAAGPQPAL